jgi:phage baseplate assembly protein W
MAKFMALLSMLWLWVLGLRIGLAGLWLLFLYAIFGSFVVLSFSAFQLEVAISAYHSKNTAPLALWEVQNLYSRWKVDADQLDAASERYRTIGESIYFREGKNRELSQNLSNTYADCRAEIISHVNDIENSIANIDQEYANILHNQIESSNFCKRNYGNRIFQIFEKTLTAKQAVRDANSASKGSKSTGLDPAIKQIVIGAHRELLNDVISAKLLQAQDIFRTIVYGTAQVEQLQRDEKLVSGKIRDLHAKLSSILRTENGKRLDNGIGDYLITLSYFDRVETFPILGYLIPNFSKMPPDTLTLILVLSMGALGGTIHLSRKHLRAMDPASHETIQPSYYMFRPFLGAITALSVFILIKAGVLVASIPSPNGETANLSPFFISFLGIVSGLLAEQAIETIERVGERFFSASEVEAPERWAYGLRTAMKGADGKDADYQQNLKGLSSLLERSEEQVEKWANEDEAVPNAFQKLIAAYFRLPLRVLFTDLKI